MLTLEDFPQEQQQYVVQLARLSSQSARVIEAPKSQDLRIKNAERVDPLIAHEFVETAKTIRV